MNEIIEKFNLEAISFFKQSEKVTIVNTNDGLFVIKLIVESEKIAYNTLKKTKYQYLKPLSSIQYKGFNYYLFNYLKTVDSEVDRAKRLFKELDELKSKTVEKRDSSKLDSFRFKKMIIVMNEKFNSIELKIREIELAPFKDDNSWIVLSKYHMILDAKLTIYKLIKKVSNEAEKIELEYSFLHSYPTLEHFKGNKLISFTNAKKGYYVNDLYKAYIDLEYLDFDIKEILDKYLKTPFSKRYFKLMVLYVYTLNLDMISFKTYEHMMQYIFYTKKIAKALSLFKDYK